jgi:NAD(P)-dependent dehydrogenase (short-subunit alcohol dehydrogenase family)
MRSRNTASGLQSLANQNRERLIVLEADFTDEKSVEELREKIAAGTSSLDQVIYNAGVFLGWSAVTKVGLETLKRNIEVNVYGAYSAAIALALLCRDRVIPIAFSSFWEAALDRSLLPRRISISTTLRSELLVSIILQYMTLPRLVNMLLLKLRELWLT